MKVYLSDGELTSQFQIPDFVLNTQRQIAKDFHSSGISFEDQFEENSLSYDEILDQVGLKLEEIMKSGERSLLQLLYQIDVPQQDFLNLTTDEEFISKAADIIIKREAYKVYLRSKF